ncbi:MAG: radical SAM protein [Planctomycetes bacterium]|nr:radical SAM protein [Planctomycetota bacterium]
MAAGAPPEPVWRVREDAHGVVVEEVATGDCLRLDAEGRWTAWQRGGATLRRALDGRVHVRRPRRDDLLADDDTARVHDAAARTAARLAALVAGGGRGLATVGDVARAAAVLARAARFDAAAALRHAAAARAVWPEGIPILPPHRYRDVVVMPALGCPNARCDFCAFYRDRRFVVPDADAFARHLDALVALLGRALDATTGVFLGSGSAASAPDDVLLDRLARTDAVLGRRPRGAAAFLDPDHTARRPAARWERLRQAGLCDLTVGLETGLPALRASVHKGADLARFEGEVAAAKAGGLRVAVTVLVGLGGAAAGPAHVRETAASVARMPLDGADLVYLSRLEGSLPEAALDAQEASMRDALGAVTRARPTVYPAEGFVARA